PLNPQGTNGGPRLIFQQRRQIDNRATGVASIFPTAARALLIRRKEREIYMFELLGTYPLNETDLVAHSFELAERLVVIEQADCGSGKLALIQHFGKFFALQ